MNAPATNASARAPSSHDRISATFLLSVIVHGVLILGITFAIAKPKPQLPTLNVTLVNTANRQTPKRADFLAQANNTGGGNSDKAKLPSQPVSGPLPTATHGQAPRPLTPRAPAPSAATGPHRITTSAPGTFAVSTDSDHRRHPAQPLPESPADLKRRLEMAKLAAAIDAASKAEARRPHKKFISASTRQYAYAAYMRAWAKKVERVGTLNFPDAARTGSLKGNLILTVGLNRDGSIHSIDVIQSSGRKVLDDAAIRIVRMAAPFAPIPHTRQKVDLLYITRTYQFLRGGRLLTH